MASKGASHDPDNALPQASWAGVGAAPAASAPIVKAPCVVNGLGLAVERSGSGRHPEGSGRTLSLSSCWLLIVLEISLGRGWAGRGDTSPFLLFWPLACGYNQFH